MRTWLLRLAAIALLLGLPSAIRPDSASACICVESDPAEMFDRADVVFAGKALSWGGVGSPAEFQVSRVWKGTAYATRLVDIGGEILDDGSVVRTSCDARFEQGEEHLIYAYYGDESRHIVSTNVCSVLLLEYAQEHLDALGEGEPPVPGMVPAEANSASGLPSWAIGLIGAAVAAVLAGLGFAAIRRRARAT